MPVVRPAMFHCLAIPGCLTDLALALSSLVEFVDLVGFPITSLWQARCGAENMPASLTPGAAAGRYYQLRAERLPLS